VEKHGSARKETEPREDDSRTVDVEAILPRDEVVVMTGVIKVWGTEVKISYVRMLASDKHVRRGERMATVFQKPELHDGQVSACSNLCVITCRKDAVEWLSPVHNATRTRFLKTSAIEF